MARVSPGSSGLRVGHPSIRGPHSDWDNVDTPVTLLAHLQDVGGNLSPQKKNPIDEARMCKLHTNSGSGREPIFFLINTITKGHWKKGRYLRTCCPRHFFNDDTSLFTELAFLTSVCPVMNPLLPWGSNINPNHSPNTLFGSGSSHLFMFGWARKYNEMT